MIKSNKTRWNCSTSLQRKIKQYNVKSDTLQYAIRYDKEGKDGKEVNKLKGNGQLSTDSKNRVESDIRQKNWTKMDIIHQISRN